MADYIQELGAKLESSKARVRKGLQMKTIRENVPALFEVIDGEISLIVNKMTQDKPLSYDEYLDMHGQVVGIKRIRNLVDAAEVDSVMASQEVTSIQGQLKQFKDEK